MFFSVYHTEEGGGLPRSWERWDDGNEGRDEGHEIHDVRSALVLSRSHGRGESPGRRRWHRRRGQWPILRGVHEAVHPWLEKRAEK